MASLREYKQFLIWSSCVFLILYLTVTVHAELPKHRKCADAKCEGKISIGITTQRYDSIEAGILSCKADDVVSIYGKNLDKEPKLWEVVLNGTRGYFPYKFIRESKTLVTDTMLTFVVPRISSEKPINAESFQNKKTIPKNSDDSTSQQNASDNMHIKTTTREFVNDEKVIHDKPDTKDIEGDEKQTEIEQSSQQNSGENESSTILNAQNVEYNAPDKEESAYITKSDAADKETESIQESKSQNKEASDNLEMISNVRETNSQEIPEVPALVDSSDNHQGMKEGNLQDENINSQVESKNFEQKAEIIEDATKTQSTEDRDALSENHVNMKGDMDKDKEHGTSEEDVKDVPLAEVTDDKSSSISKHTDLDSNIPNVDVVTEDIQQKQKEGIIASLKDHLPENPKEDIQFQPQNDVLSKNDNEQMASTGEQNPILTDQLGDATLSNNDKLNPTPARFEFIDGTAIPVDNLQDSDIPQSTEAYYEETPLQASQHDVGADISSTEKTPLFHELTGTPSSNEQVVSEGNVKPGTTDQLWTEILASSIVSYIMPNGNDFNEGQTIGSRLSQDEQVLAEDEEFSKPKPQSLLSDENLTESPLNSESNLSESNLSKNIEPSIHDSLNMKNNLSGNSKDDLLASVSDQEDPVQESTSSEHTEQPTTDKTILDNEQNLKQEIGNLTFIDPEVLDVPHHSHSNIQLDIETSSEDSVITENILTADKEAQTDQFSFLGKILDMARPLLGEDLALAVENEVGHVKRSSGSLMLLMIISGTIVTLYFVHMVIVKMSREAPLLDTMNKIARDMRITAEENIGLKKRLATSNGQHMKLPPSNQRDQQLLHELQRELDTVKAYYQVMVDEKQEKMQHLEQELEESTANGMEMHKMLDELLSSQREASSFQASVDGLQMMLDSQREKVESLTSDLALKTRLNDELRNEMRSTKQKASKLEYQIEQLSHSLEEVNIAKHDALKRVEVVSSTLSFLEDTKLSLSNGLAEAKAQNVALSQQVASLNSSLKKAKNQLSGKEAEIQVSKECLKKIQISCGKGSKKEQLSEIFNIIEVKAQLLTVGRERDTFLKQLEESTKSQECLQQTLSSRECDLGSMKETQEKACKDRNAAVSKLEVLTKYFKEKEVELTKELESQECLRVDAEGSVSKTSSKIQNYELELASCRSQIETFKSEIEEQKQSYKMQLTNEEKKAHENWLAARASERRQEELRQENGQLRQRLTLMLRDSEGQHMIIKPLPKRIEANGNVSSPGSTEGDLDLNHSSPLGLDHHLPPIPHMLPPPMFPPIPPPHFLGHLPPPPPLPDRRLPPAGCIASPPFMRQSALPAYERRSYSPNSDHSQYSDRRYSPTRNASSRYSPTANSSSRYSPTPNSSGRYSPNSSTRYSPSGQRRDHSPNRRFDRSRHMYDYRGDQAPSPPPSRGDRHSPDRWYTRSPEGYRHQKSYYYNDSPQDERQPRKGQKTSTPITPNER